MKVSQLMSDDLITVLMDDEIDTVKAIFDTKAFHHLLVVDKSCRKLYGILSDRDLLKALHPKIYTNSATLNDYDCLNIKVHQIMSRHPVTLNEDSHIEEAIALFNQFNVSCLPVLNDEGRPVGILSWRDMLKAMADLFPPCE